MLLFDVITLSLLLCCSECSSEPFRPVLGGRCHDRVIEEMRRRHVANENCVLGGSLFERIAFPRTGNGFFNCFWCCFSPSSFLFRRRVSEFVTNQPLDRWQLPISIVPNILLCTLLSLVFVINFILKNQKEKRLSSYCFQQHLFYRSEERRVGKEC